MLATSHSYSKNCALDVLWKQVMVNSIPDYKYKYLFRMEPACNSVDLFSIILLGNDGACPQDTFQISVPWFYLNKAETLSKEFFFSYSSLWKLHEHVEDTFMVLEPWVSSLSPVQRIKNPSQILK